MSSQMPMMSEDRRKEEALPSHTESRVNCAFSVSWLFTLVALSHFSLAPPVRAGFALLKTALCHSL